jgi:hypothetical protein
MLLDSNYMLFCFQLLSQETSEQKDFLDTLQISVSNSDLNITESNSRVSEPAVLPVKTEDVTRKENPVTCSLYSDNNNLSEVQLRTKHAKMSVNTVPCREAGSARLKQGSLKLSHIKKSEEEGKSVRKAERAPEIQEVNKGMCKR